MRLFKLLLRHQTVVPVLAICFATAISLVLVIGLVLAAENVPAGLRRHGYLIWNLFLAWVPLLFALLADEQFQAGTKRNWRLAGLIFGWLIFFPNAPYIFTDVVHISLATARHYWADLAIILTCALTGLMLWFVSLYLMQGLVARKLGDAKGWVFVAAMAALSSFGIYLGRFLRFNSWDLLTKPGDVYQGVSSWTSSAFSEKMTVAFPLLFTAFLFTSYLMLYALTHLSPAKPAMVPADKL